MIWIFGLRVHAEPYHEIETGLNSTMKIFPDAGMKLFRELDTNQDGQVSRQELIDGMASRGTTLSPDQVDAIMEQADRDKSGGIDVQEFQIFARSAPSTVRLQQLGRPIQAVFSNRPQWVSPERSHWMVKASQGPSWSANQRRFVQGPTWSQRGEGAPRQQRLGSSAANSTTGRGAERVGSHQSRSTWQCE